LLLLRGSLFPKGLSGAEITALIQQLQSTGKVTVAENKVIYADGTGGEPIQGGETLAPRPAGAVVGRFTIASCGTSRR